MLHLKYVITIDNTVEHKTQYTGFSDINIYPRIWFQMSSRVLWNEAYNNIYAEIHINEMEPI